MIKIDVLESLPDVKSLVEPKKKILELARLTEGSMLKFQTTVKHSSEIDELAEEFFTVRNIADGLKNKSRHVNTNNLIERINKIKNMKVNTDDFI